MAIEQVDTSQGTVELELRLRDPDCFFVAVSDRESCSVELEEMVQRSDGRLVEFFTVRAAAPGRVLELAGGFAGIEEARIVRSDGTESLLQLVVDGDCVTVTLADAGAVTRSVSAADGEGRVIADVPPHVDVRSVVEEFRARHDSSELVARRECDRCVGVTRREAERDLLSALTPRQEEAVRTAYLSGYFSWPRDSDAAACAAALGVSQPTFSQHLRAAQRRLLRALFDEGGDP
jgi:predicted DNA binding protein